MTRDSTMCHYKSGYVFKLGIRQLSSAHYLPVKIYTVPKRHALCTSFARHCSATLQERRNVLRPVRSYKGYKFVYNHVGSGGGLNPCS